MKKLTLTLGTALLASACATAPVVAPQGAPTLAAKGKLVTVRGDVKIVDPKAFKLKGVGTDQPRVPYELRRLDHIEVWIANTTLGENLHYAGTLNHMGSSDADHTFDPVVLQNLQPFSNYTVQLKAWQHDPAQGGIVQVDDNAGGASETTFTTSFNDATITDGANESVTLSSGFSLKLADQDFNGVVNGNITSDDGTLNGPGVAEQLWQPAPPALTFEHLAGGDLFVNTAGLQGQDGEADGHFKLALDLPPGAVVEEIWMDSVVGRSWHSKRNGFWWGLGVKHDGTLLNPTAEEAPLGTFQGPTTFELITHSGEAAYVSPGNWFKAYAKLAGGKVLEADLTIAPLPAINNFAAQIVRVSDDMLGVDSDMLVFYNGTDSYPVHSSNPCGGGFACGTPGDPAYNPTSGSFLLNDGTPEADTASFTVTSNPAINGTIGVIRLRFNRALGQWEWLDFTPEAGQTYWYMRPTPAI